MSWAVKTLLAVTLAGLLVPAESAAGDLYGRVARPAAVAPAAPKITRYREHISGDVSGSTDQCRCNPGLFSVVYLTGDSLPPLHPADSVPSIAQKDKMFVPSVLAVTVGSTVDFPNLDPFFHNVFSYSQTKKFDLGRYAQGNSKQVTFDKPGIVSVFCEIHYTMRAYVHVLETPYHAVSDDRGNFSIRSIRPGNYILNVWQENLPTIQRDIKIAGDSTFVVIDK